MVIVKKFQATCGHWYRWICQWSDYDGRNTIGCCLISIQEQNSFAGMVNKQVAAKVSKVCVAYEGMEKYFPKDKIVLTGNPVRKDILSDCREKR
jgi:UDP-N-acetylglucosamine:LPS N-acetylglucosamine transferase